MNFVRSRTAILLDFESSRPDELSVAVLLKKATKAKCFDALIRVRKEYEHDVVFDSGWWAESTDETYITLRKAVNIRASIRN